jgi:hypothetical protein
MSKGTRLILNAESAWQRPDEDPIRGSPLKVKIGGALLSFLDLEISN